MTAAEYDRLARAAGRRARTNDEGRCPYLTADGQCSGYRARPLVCRLWGAIDHPQMRCPHGCRPPQLLSDREGLALIARMKVAAESVRPGGGRHEFIQAPDTSDLQHLIGALSYLEQMKG